MERLVVIGNGMVGLKFVEELTARIPGRFAVTVIGAEPEPAYNRVLLSAVLAGDASDEDCRLKPQDWYEEHGIDLRLGNPVAAIDLDDRSVQLGDEVLKFDRLVLATGSQPIRLPKPGLDLPGVEVFRTFGDLARIAEAGSDAHAVVVGGGLLGLEAACGLAKRGVKTTLLHIGDRVMERQVDSAGARLIEAAMARFGVTVLLQADLAKVHGTDRAEAVELSDGRVIPADLVIQSIGVRPDAGLARDAGIATARGILVDDRLETSVPGIYAVGECAEHRGLCLGLVAPGYDQARLLARHLSGDDVAYQGSVSATNLKVSGVPVFSAGNITDDQNRVTLSDPEIGFYRKLVFRDDRLIGALLVGDASDGPWYLELIESARPIGRMRRDLVFGRAFVREAA